MKIPFFSFERRIRQNRRAIMAAAARVFERGQFILGPELAEFERRFAESIGGRHAVGVNSGTDAIYLALR
ncbi:MAG: DegT/DnrJ/EryC1/StrS family aminotransferase, partial [Chthoniobacterales bacterium]